MELAEKQIVNVEKDNQSLRKQLIIEYLPYVKNIVHRIAIHLPASVDTDDLISSGIIGLIQAIERYDPTRDNKFTTYATFRIRGAVLSELRSRDFLSRSDRMKTRELERAYLKLESKLGREVNDEEVAQEMGLSLEDLFNIKKISAISFISLGEMGYSSKEDKSRLMSCLNDGDSDDLLCLTRIKELQSSLAKAIDELPEKERLIISLYYWDELTMKEIGKVLDITESRICQIHSSAVLRLRKKLGREGLLED
jgi:RNA polymerase sigma factor for flagellar operon FliA